MERTFTGEYMSIENLRHTVRYLANGAQVIVLDTGAILDPEAVAMLQALYSRSVEGFHAHLEILKKKGPAKFMESFYVGYGHKSIGDCGFTVIFIEGVSMLVAKAIQDSMLYSGQEASTRYIDFAHQPFITPKEIGEVGKSLQEKARKFYIEGLAVMTDHIAKKFPISEGEKEQEWMKAVKARAFDIMRGFLPAGASTKLSWTTNLRQAADHLMLLRHHPLEEVRQVALAIEDALKEAHPHSFAHKRYADTEDYNAFWMNAGYLLTGNCFTGSTIDNSTLVFKGIDKLLLRTYKQFLLARPKKTDIPKKIGSTGTVRFKCMLDFGSFRDIQRHRAVIQQMPLVTDAFGFHKWYLGELETELQKRARDLLSNQVMELSRLPLTPELKQYCVLMGYKLPCTISGDLPALVYLAELRGTRFVHPTLRARALEIADILEQEFGEYGLVIHRDPEPDRFDVRRGTHDIVPR